MEHICGVAKYARTDAKKLVLPIPLGDEQAVTNHAGVDDWGLCLLLLLLGFFLRLFMDLFLKSRQLDSR